MIFYPPNLSQYAILIIIHLSLHAISNNWSNSMPIRLHCNYVIHSVYKEGILNYFNTGDL